MQEDSTVTSRLLPVFEAPATDRVWLVAAHGGAGCTTIYRSAPDGYADAGRALPVCADKPCRMVVCAQGTVEGLRAVQGVLLEWVEGSYGPTVLCGVVVTNRVARLPPVLRDAYRQVDSAAPRFWRLPYISGLEVQGFPARYPRAYRGLHADLLRDR